MCLVCGYLERGVDEGGEALKVRVVMQGLVEEGVGRMGGSGTVEEGDYPLEDIMEGGEDARFQCKWNGGCGGGQGE